MRLILAPMCLALLAAGCLSAPDDDAQPPTATPPPGSGGTPTGFAGATVYDDDIDFSQDPAGADVVKEATLEFPAGARMFTFSANFTSDTPTASAKEVRVWLVDGSGETVAECDLGVSPVTTAESRDCGPTTNNVEGSGYSLRWRGFGNLRAHVVVTAS